MKQELSGLIRKLDMKSINTQMALQCAPLFSGLKVSNLLIISDKAEESVYDLLDGTEISCYLLANAKGRKTYFLYRERALLSWLNLPDNLNFLCKIGYDTVSLEALLIDVRKKYEAYLSDGAAFPHEIGILLGYPSQDVIGFVVNGGRNYLGAGYWKVYANLEETQHLFERFDLAKETLIRRIVRGVPLQSMIVRFNAGRTACV